MISKSTQRALADLPATHTRYVSSSTLPPLSLSTIRLTCVLCSPSPRFYRLVSSSDSAHVPFALCLRPLLRVDWPCRPVAAPRFVILLASFSPSQYVDRATKIPDANPNDRESATPPRNLSFQVVVGDIRKSFLFTVTGDSHH